MCCSPDEFTPASKIPCQNRSFRSVISLWACWLWGIMSNSQRTRSPFTKSSSLFYKKFIKHTHWNWNFWARLSDAPSSEVLLRDLTAACVVTGLLPSAPFGINLRLEKSISSSQLCKPACQGSTDRICSCA